MKNLLNIIIFCCLILGLNLNAKESYSINFDKETKGLIRKFLVYKNPSWVGKVVNKESKEYFFVSPKSMLEFYFNPQKWPDANIKTQDEIKELIVTDYSTLKAINAKKAYYVYGSNKISPAGDDLPAFKTYEEAEKFAKNNNGKRVLSFKELKNSLIQLLNGRI